MSNIKLKDHYWETSGVFDKVQNKTQRELNSEIPGKVDSSAVGAASGVASLDSSGKVPVGQLPVDSALSRSSTNPVQNKVIAAALGGKAPAIYDTANGAVASFPDGADGMPIKSLVLNIEPVQAAGTPSPENPLPISGWTGCTISHSGADTTDPTQVSVSWSSAAGTIYGGKLDVVSGVLTVDAVGLEFNGDETWAQQGSNPYRLFRYVVSGVQTTADLKTKRACSHFPNGSVLSTSVTSGYYAYTSSGNDNIWFQFRPDLDQIPDLASWKSYLAAQFSAGTPVQAFCPISTPITYQLTPQEVNTLLGTNNIWADCGPVAVEYPADTQLYIQKINAPSDDDMTADTQIASGRYFIVGGTLYLSTTTIPAGDTIIPGTNCTITNLAEALNALNT